MKRSLARPTVIVPLVLLAALALDLRIQPGSSRTTRAIDDLLVGIVPLFSGIATIWTARRMDGRLRLSWRLIGAGITCWGLGEMIWFYFEILRRVDVPFPGPADIGFLLFPVLAGVGVLLRPSQAFAAHGRLRVAIDVLVVLASLFTVSWATAFGLIYRGGADSLLAQLVSLAYPASDIGLLTVVIVVLAHATAESRWGLALLGAGLSVFAISDSGFAYLTATGGYHTGVLIDLGWPAGFVLMMWGAARDVSGTRGTGLQRFFLPLVLPTVPTLVGLAFVIYKFGTSVNDRVLLCAGVAMILLLLIRQVVAMADNQRLVVQMSYQAFHDPLTGLSNRAVFNDRLDNLLARHGRSPGPIAVLLIDLDDFKRVNDTFGHAAGDELLLHISKILRSMARRGDTAARLGGDEFALILENSAAPELVAARLHEKLASPFFVVGREIVSGASIGICQLGPGDPTPTPDDVMQRADLAMYAAKRAGKGSTRSYSNEMDAAVDEQSTLRADIAGGRLDVAYQPIFTVDRHVMGVEALARWNGRTGRDFLDLIRRLGQVRAVDEAVLRIAATAAARFGDLPVSVNVDRSTLSEPGFVDRLRAVLADASLPPERLVLELRDLDFGKHDPALTALAEARALGVLLAVDDFGTGSATLRRLRELQPAYIKIDGSLVDEGDDPQAAALLAGTAHLGRLLGATVVAEGIETPAQRHAAARAGCAGVQGYLFGAPVDLETLVRVLDPERDAVSL